MASHAIGGLVTGVPEKEEMGADVPCRLPAPI